MTFGFSFKVLFYFLQHEVKGQVDSEEARPKMINSVLSVFILTLICSIQKFISCTQHSRAWWEDDSGSTLFWGLKFFFSGFCLPVYPICKMFWLACYQPWAI